GRSAGRPGRRRSRGSRVRRGRLRRRTSRLCLIRRGGGNAHRGRGRVLRSFLGAAAGRYLSLALPTFLAGGLRSVGFKNGSEGRKLAGSLRSLPADGLFESPYKIRVNGTTAD